MTLLSIALVVFSLLATLVGGHAGDKLVLLLAAAGFVSAFTIYRGRHMSSFLRIFAATFAVETILFGTVYLLTKVDLWPHSLDEYLLPESLPLTVALFSIAVYCVSFIPVVRSMTKIADRYFDATDQTTARIWPFPSFRGLERRIATAMVVLLVVINQAQVGMEVRLSYFSRDWFNAIQEKDQKAFWYQLFTVFTFWCFIYIASAVLEFVVTSTLIIRWRHWLTNFYTSRWLDRHTHYRMSLAGISADNPDQRIAEDVNRFIDGGQVGSGIYSFSILLISKLSSLVSFAIILWILSANFTLPYTTIALPGFLFWVALIYAGLGTIVTHWIGRPLVNLSFTRQRYEADFRFSLARLREYGEQIALLSGEATEKAALEFRFGAIIRNYFEIVAVRKRLTAFVYSFQQVNPIIPFVVSAPFYFTGKITLGIMTQTARAFGSVNDALTFFVSYYVSLADFRSVLERLISFDAAIEKARTEPTSLTRPTDLPSGRIVLDDVSLRLPDGRIIVSNVGLQLTPTEAALVIGPSGSGKSTLFRAMAGIWPYTDGTIAVPAAAKVMVLPQKPYLPIGTLRAAVTYPAAPDSFDEARLRAVLTAVKLGGFVDKLDIEDIWSQRLSGGEQQRLAIARALLAKPDWLFLDEATAAMDEKMETAIYAALAQELPTTTIVSIGHRSSLTAFHTRQLEMKPGADATFTPADLATAAE